MGTTGNRAIPQFTLGSKLSCYSGLSSLLCIACEKPLVEPIQCTCGDRICSDCCKSSLARSETHFTCGRCSSKITADDCFRDKAADNDLKTAVFPCLYPSCLWSGSAANYRDHVNVCAYGPIHCPNAGCDFVGPRSELVSHLASCPSLLVTCDWCQENVPRNALSDHLSSCCSRVAIKCIDCPIFQLLRTKECFCLLCCGALLKTTTDFRHHTHCCNCLLQMRELMHIIKHLEEDHDHHPVHSRSSQGPPLSKSIQETDRSHEESVILFPASSADALYRTEHHFCYLVPAIQETASQD